MEIGLPKHVREQQIQAKLYSTISQESRLASRLLDEYDETIKTDG